MTDKTYTFTADQVDSWMGSTWNEVPTVGYLNFNIPDHRTADVSLTSNPEHGRADLWLSSWAHDISEMHKKYGFHEAMRNMDEETRRKYLEFRADFLQEELDELRDNINNPEEVVDALIDLIVVATGTLDLFDVNAKRAWQEVHRANMSKEVGMKETRQNDFGAPDLVKPEGWVAPSHNGNHGRLPR